MRNFRISITDEGKLKISQKSIDRYVYAL